MKSPMHWMVVLFSLVAVGVASGAETSRKLKVLVVTGGHGFQREPFFKMFQDNPDIAFTQAEHVKDADVYDREDLLSYHVVALYDMPKTITEAQKTRFLILFEKGIGVVVMHHALVSYPDWPEYTRIIGGHYRQADEKMGKAGYQHDVDFSVLITAKDHPVVAGLKDFKIHDEIYWGFTVASDAIPLITTDHPKSGKPLGWTRSEKKSRLVYLQLGHDQSAFNDPNYRKLLSQAIQWTGSK